MGKILIITAILLFALSFWANNSEKNKILQMVDEELQEYCFEKYSNSRQQNIRGICIKYFK